MIMFHLSFIQVSVGPTMISFLSNFVCLTTPPPPPKFYGSYLEGLKEHFGLCSSLFLSIRPSKSSVLLTLEIFPWFQDFDIIILRNFTLNLFLDSVYAYFCIGIG